LTEIRNLTELTALDYDYYVPIQLANGTTKKIKLSTLLGIAPVGDPLWNDVALLLPLSTNSGLVDAKGKAVTNNGSTLISTAIADPFGGNLGVAAFTGSNWLSVAQSADFSFANGAFGIDGWFYFTSFPTSQWGLFDFRPVNYGGVDKPLLTGNTDNGVGVGQLGWYEGSYAYTANPVPLNTWLYVCIARDLTGFTTLKINGALVATNASRGTNMVCTNPILFGARADTIPGYNGKMVGYASNVRITRAYRDGSIVPSAPFPTN
jgi:hypothetical protein